MKLYIGGLQKLWSQQIPQKRKLPTKKKKGARDYTMDDLPEMCLDVIHSK